MNYNEELLKLKDKESKLIKKAEKEGYKLINGTLTKDTYVPVVEVYTRAETEYEAYGGFYVFKKVIPITFEQLDKIKELKQTKENLANNFIYDGVLSEIEELNGLYEILDWGNFETESIGRIVDDFEEEYCLNDGQNLYLEFFFKSDNMDGYISVYDMPIEDLDGVIQENTELYFNKYLTYN